MKAKKTARILCALFAAALCLSCVSATAFAAKKPVNYNGGEYGWLIYNDYEYYYSVILNTEASEGGYSCHCSTEAAVIRTQEALHGQWLTKNYGIVKASGGAYETGPVAGITRSPIVVCPKGRSQIKECVRVDTTSIFRADTKVVCNVYKKY